MGEHMFVKLLILVTVAALAVGLVARTSHGAGPERTYVVQPSDTLWSIAARTYAGDVREGVWKLEQRNHLDSATIVPGEKLVLPGG
jgi:LysM repeat protein